MHAWLQLVHARKRRDVKTMLELHALAAQGTPKAIKAQIAAMKKDQ